jgi:hypothetical protein
MSEHPSNARDIDIEELFTFHPPTGDQPDRYVAIRGAAKVFANTVLSNCPSCADRAVAIREIREAVMVANASIALEPR